MKQVLLLLVLFCSTVYAIEDQNIVVHIKASHFEGEGRNKSKVSSQGTGVIIDASEYGFDGNHYILTAAHVVIDIRTGKLKPLIEAQIGDVWEEGRCVRYDEDYDLAIIKFDVELKGIKIRKEKYAEDEVKSIAFPLGGNLKISKGKILMHSHNKNKARWVSANYIDHGSSGGAIVTVESEPELVGIITDGFVKDKNEGYEMKHDKTVFVSSKYIIEFLKGEE